MYIKLACLNVRGLRVRGTAACLRDLFSLGVYVAAILETNFVYNVDARVLSSNIFYSARPADQRCFLDR